MLLILLFGITEFGRAWMTVNILTSAAREGCRMAVVTAPNTAMVTNRVNQVCNSAGITPTSVTVTGPVDTDPERRVTVTVQADFQILSGDILGGFSGTIPLRVNSVMRHESI
jgi:Flp pilus assembly protein TadG